MCGVGFQRQLNARFFGSRLVFTWQPVPGNNSNPPLALSQLVFCWPHEIRAYTVFFALMIWSTLNVMSCCRSWLGAVNAKPAVFRPSPTLKRLGSGEEFIKPLDGLVEAEPQRIVGDNVVGGNGDAGQHVAARINRGARRAGGVVASSRHVPEDALPRRLSVDGLRYRGWSTTP